MAWSLSHILRLGLVPLNGDCTIADEKTFSGVTRIQNTLAGPRRSVLTRGAASSQPTSADSHAYITTDGAITIPTATGWECLLKLGGDHDISFNSTTCDVSAEGWASGDLLKVEVKSSTAIEVWRLVASADLGAFA